ncbi:hypothetical protein MPH_01127 [Macrophomina phaseolina MS6]|uniref:Uncharacterized protein n=1 Tax=Macrophomina phaseolina (strain MS6) TaxID=1126212 RepID=K2S3R0_MACPH|nr:hypothetical protein MPH_01127 [Macrophomina phaseolina MS6]
MEETGHQIRHDFRGGTVRQLELVKKENRRRLDHVTCKDEQGVLLIKHRTARSRRTTGPSQCLKFGQSLEHEGIEVPSAFLAVRQAVGEQVDQHALASADLTVKHQAFGRVEVHGLLMAGQDARQGQAVALLLLGQQRGPEAAGADILDLSVSRLGGRIGAHCAAYLMQAVAVLRGRLIVF